MDTRHLKLQVSQQKVAPNPLNECQIIATLVRGRFVLQGPEDHQSNQHQILPQRRECGPRWRETPHGGTGA